MGARTTILLTALTAALVLAVASPLAAAPAASSKRTSCAQRVIADWAKNQRLDRRYTIKCYSQALRVAPDDLVIYTTFARDVRKARAKAVKTCKRIHGKRSIRCRL